MLEIPGDAVFAYSITQEPDVAFAQSEKLAGSLFLNTTEKTESREFTNVDGSSQAVVIGFCVDAHGERSRDEIPQMLLEAALDSGIKYAYELCNRLAGKYIVYLSVDGETVVWGDATCSMSVFYTHADPVVACGVSENLVGAYVSNRSDSRMSGMTTNAPNGQPLPGNMTSFDHVRILLPNHILYVRQQYAERVWETPGLARRTTLDEVIGKTLFLMSNIYREYNKYYDLLCPLTAGYDSRVNFAFMKELGDNPKTFTFRHPSFTDETPDLTISHEICGYYDMPHTVVVDSHMEESEKSYYRRVIGRDATDYALDLALTIKNAFGENAILNGNIIDQIGKSVTGNRIPEVLASPSFIRARIYNTGKPALKILGSYLRGVKLRCGDNIFDVVAWEQDCCRWGTQSDITYGMCGVNMLTLSNCRELILEWIKVPRKQRVRKELHKSLFQQLDPKLLSFGFTPESNIKRIVRLNWPIFYLSCYGYGWYVSRHSR